MKRKKILSRFIESNVFSALIGVLIGGLITGYISFKTQDILIENQNNKFKNQYLINKNIELKSYLNEYLEHLFILTSSEAEETEKRKNTLQRMSVISTKISLLNNPEIGLKCTRLTNELETYIFNKVDSKKAELAKNDLLNDVLYELEKLENEIKGIYKNWTD